MNVASSITEKARQAGGVSETIQPLLECSDTCFGYSVVLFA